MSEPDPIDEILSLLDGVTQDGNGWKACCPAHEDNTPSLSISVGDDGKVLLHDFGGCSVDDVLSAIGLDKRRLFRASTPNSRRRDNSDHRPQEHPSARNAIHSYERKHGKPVAEWEYHNADGTVVLIVCRFNQPDGSKEFRPVSLGDDGKWYCKAPEKRPLYNLLEVIDADTVYVTEGEKAADAAKSLGLVATTSMNGAKSPKKSDWTPLTDKNVVILPDNDAAGRAYATTVQGILRGLGATVKIVLLPMQNAGDDIYDWIEAHGDSAEPDAMREELESLVSGADTPIQAANESEPVKLRFMTAGELLRAFPSLKTYLIEGLMRAAETMNIISAPKFGKSWLVLGLVLCIACGLKWLGKFWCKRGRVLLIDNELHPETLASRLPRVAEAMGLKLDDYQDNVCVITLRGQLIDLERLSCQLLTLEPGSFDLIVLDAWYRLQPKGSDENANGDVTQLYNLLDMVAGQIGSGFVCVHHSSKGNQSGKSVTDVGSGAGAQARAPDVHMVLRAHEADNAVVVDAAIRSSAPLAPFCMVWNWPVWSVAENLDPKDLRTDKPKKKTAELLEGGIPPVERKELEGRRKILQAYADKPDGDTASQIRGASGMSGSTFPPINAALLREGMIVACRVKKSYAEYDGFKITTPGLEALGQLGQLGQNTPQSDLSDIGGGPHRDKRSPLGVAVCPGGPTTSDRMGSHGEHSDNLLSDMPEWESKA